MTSSEEKQQCRGEDLAASNSEEQWESWILTAIGKVRFQKQRPNMERVAAVLRQVTNGQVIRLFWLI